MKITSSEVQPLHASTPVYNNNYVPQETFRVLFAWLDDELAVQVRSSLIAETPENHARAVAHGKALVESRPVFTPNNPVTEIAENERVRAIKARPEFSYIETEVRNEDPEASCRIALVNLNDIVAFQPFVRIDDLQDRLVQRPLDDEALYKLCFPSNQPSETVTIDVDDQGGYIITTLDPNIKVVPWKNIPANPPLALPRYELQYPSASSGIPMQLFPFAMLRAPNYLQVVHYEDRYILRNGYNRAAALLYQHIETVPCMVIETQAFEAIGFKPTMLDPDIVMGEHPPRLADFWQDAVTCLYQTEARRKVYHISMKEMKIWR